MDPSAFPLIPLHHLLKGYSEGAISKLCQVGSLVEVSDPSPALNWANVNGPEASDGLDLFGGQMALWPPVEWSGLFFLSALPLLSGSFQVRCSDSVGSWALSEGLVHSVRADSSWRPFWPYHAKSLQPSTISAPLSNLLPRLRGSTDALSPEGGCEPWIGGRETGGGQRDGFASVLMPRPSL